MSRSGRDLRPEVATNGHHPGVPHQEGSPPLQLDPGHQAVAGRSRGGGRGRGREAETEGQEEGAEHRIGERGTDPSIDRRRGPAPVGSGLVRVQPAADQDRPEDVALVGLEQVLGVPRRVQRVHVPPASEHQPSTLSVRFAHGRGAEVEKLAMRTARQLVG